MTETTDAVVAPNETASQRIETNGDEPATLLAPRVQIVVAILAETIARRTREAQARERAAHDDEAGM